MNRKKKWTRERIIEAMHAWKAERGSQPTANEWQGARTEGEDRPNLSTVNEAFGRWNNAIDAAGFQRRGPGFPQKRVWTDEAIIARIQAWANEHGRQPSSVEWDATPGVPSRNLIQRRFGSWSAGVYAAGFPRPRKGTRLGPKRVNHMKSVTVPPKSVAVPPKKEEARKEWSREELIQAIRDWNEEYGRPPVSNDWDSAQLRSDIFRSSHGRWPGPSRIKNTFGSWNAGIRAAGFEPRLAGVFKRPEREEMKELRERYLDQLTAG